LALAPSAYEGFGHMLHEARSAGAYVVTTDAAPMREWAAGRIPVAATRPQGLATLADVSPEAVRDAVERCAALDDAAVERAGAEARAAFLAEGAAFAARLHAML
jgi:glycosyltransferase involved in cell wall biosynthesis